MGDWITDYTKFDEAMGGILKSKSKLLKVVVIYFDGSWGSLSVRVSGELDQMYRQLKRRHGNWSIKLVKVSVAKLKEMISVFDLESFPTVFVLKRDLSVAAKFTLEDVMGGRDEVLKKFYKIMHEYNAPPEPQADTFAFMNVLDDHISRVVENRETTANTHPNFMGLVWNLKAIVSELEEWVDLS